MPYTENGVLWGLLFLRFLAEGKSEPKYFSFDHFVYVLLFFEILILNNSFLVTFPSLII